MKKNTRNGGKKTIKKKKKPENKRKKGDQNMIDKSTLTKGRLSERYINRVV